MRRLNTLEDDRPVAQCSDCGRRTWDPSMIGQTCYHPRPGGESCAGKLNAIERVT